MQQSDIQKVGVYFEPIFSKECDISAQDYKDLQKHIFSKIPVFSQKRVKPDVSKECNVLFLPSVSTTYVFRITDFDKDERKSVISLLHYKLFPKVSKKILGNDQHVYEIKIQVLQKTKQQYHLWLTVQTETQVKNQKKLKKLNDEEIKASLLKEKIKMDKQFDRLLTRANVQNALYVLGKNKTTRTVLSSLETAEPYVVGGDLRDMDALAKGA